MSPIDESIIFRCSRRFIYIPLIHLILKMIKIVCKTEGTREAADIYFMSKNEGGSRTCCQPSLVRLQHMCGHSHFDQVIYCIRGRCDAFVVTTVGSTVTCTSFCSGFATFYHHLPSYTYIRHTTNPKSTHKKLPEVYPILKVGYTLYNFPL